MWHTYLDNCALRFYRVQSDSQKAISGIGLHRNPILVWILLCMSSNVENGSINLLQSDPSEIELI
jgi:hypothetical protein